MLFWFITHGHIVSKKLTIPRLLEELVEVPKEKWFMLGCWLKLSPDILRNIATYYGGDDYYMMVMLCTWMKKGEEIKWSVVVDAVRNIEMEGLAKKIASKYGIQFSKYYRVSFIFNYV